MRPESALVGDDALVRRPDKAEFGDSGITGPAAASARSAGPAGDPAGSEGRWQRVKARACATEVLPVTLIFAAAMQVARDHRAIGWSDIDMLSALPLNWNFF
jgi:hypothetical protein